MTHVVGPSTLIFFPGPYELWQGWKVQRKLAPIPLPSSFFFFFAEFPLKLLFHNPSIGDTHGMNGNTYELRIQEENDCLAVDLSNTRYFQHASDGECLNNLVCI